MFRNLVSNLPFNPSLVQQVSFYAKRVQQESTLRRIGFGLIALAMFIQMFAIIAPPEKSLAFSDNHIINGLTTKAGILSAWDTPSTDVALIYSKMGLTRADIEKLPNSPNKTIVSDRADYWTIGRNSLANYSNVNDAFKKTEVALTYAPGKNVYMRDLQAWDIRNPRNTYQAWEGHKADGTTFWILKDCGNYTQIGKMVPQRPLLEIRKTIIGKPTSVKPGDTFTFRFEYRNRQQDSLAEQVLIQDDFDLTNYDIVSPAKISLAGNIMRQPVGNLSYSATYKVLDVTVKVKNPFSGVTNKLCNVATLKAVNAIDAKGGPACVTVVIPCQYNPALSSSDPNCKPPQPPVTPCAYDPSLKKDDPKCVPAKVFCSLTDSDINKTTREVTFKTVVTSTNEKVTSVYGYNYEFGDGAKQVKESKLFSDTTKHTYPVGKFTAKVTIVYGVLGVAGGKQQADCDTSIEFDSEKPFGEMKTVKNITQKLEGTAALNSVVKAGDVLEYALTTTNTQDFDRKNITISDYVGDILEYATLDEAFLKQQGGTFDATSKKVSFVLGSVTAKSDVTKSFKVTLKNPIPATNAPSKVSGSYDCRISNKYGNELSMAVACPAVKGVETLPNTGPGTSAIIGFIVVTIVGYFYARSRVLSKELALIRAEYAPRGGF